MDYVVCKELRSNGEAKTHTFLSDRVCHYIQDVSKMPGQTSRVSY